MNIKELNNKFGIDGQVIFFEGKGRLPCINVTNAKASALVSIYAGHVLSYQPVNESDDFIYVSDKAIYQNGKAIRGGIPICWPWFGADPVKAENPAHGVARNNYWSFSNVVIMENGDTKLILSLSDSESSRMLWPYSFHLSLEINIGTSLTLELVTKNTGDQTFSITEALHTYFKVGDSTQVRVLGLENTQFLDKTDDFKKNIQEGQIILSNETDRIYTDISHDLTIVDPVLDRKIKIGSSGNNHIVVWNPWENGAAKLADMANEDYKKFICVEVANAIPFEIEIAPDTEHRIMTHYSA